MTNKLQTVISKGWKLGDAIDGLMAYDLGCKDSGIKDDNLKEEVRKYLQNLTSEEFRYVVSEYARDLLNEEALKQGYGLADVIEFVKWLENELYLSV